MLLENCAYKCLQSDAIRSNDFWDSQRTAGADPLKLRVLGAVTLDIKAIQNEYTSRALRFMYQRMKNLCS